MSRVPPLRVLATLRVQRRDVNKVDIEIRLPEELFREVQEGTGLVESVVGNYPHLTLFFGQKLLSSKIISVDRKKELLSRAMCLSASRALSSSREECFEILFQLARNTPIVSFASLTEANSFLGALNDKFILEPLLFNHIDKAWNLWFDEAKSKLQSEGRPEGHRNDDKSEWSHCSRNHRSDDFWIGLFVTLQEMVEKHILIASSLGRFLDVFPNEMYPFVIEELLISASKKGSFTMFSDLLERAIPLSVLTFPKVTEMIGHLTSKNGRSRLLSFEKLIRTLDIVDPEILDSIPQNSLSGEFSQKFVEIVGIDVFAA